VWINPNHPNPPRQTSPPAPRDSGQRVATFPRFGGEELRVSLAEYEGYPYLSLRVWAKGYDGQWWPQKGKGVSIKLGEVGGLAEALANVAERLAAEDESPPIQRQAGPEPPRRGSARPPFVDPGNVATGYTEGFNEFD
jgi:hypothetical protein